MSQDNSNPHDLHAANRKTWSWESEPQDVATNGKMNEEITRQSKRTTGDSAASQRSNKNLSEDEMHIHPALRKSTHEAHAAVEPNGPLSMAIPEPHLPLRKRASEELRSRATQPGQIENEDRSGGMADFVQRLRPETLRWSRDSDLERNFNFSNIEEEQPDTSETKEMTPPYTSSTNETDADGSLPSLVRSSTSVSDQVEPQSYHTSQPEGLPGAQALSPTPGQTNLYNKNPLPLWRDINAQSLRESIMTSTTEATTTISEPRSSDVWTARSSRTRYESQSSDWHRDSDDDFSVEDCIAMYADMPDGPRESRVRKSEDIPPVPPIVIPVRPPRADNDSLSPSLLAQFPPSEPSSALSGMASSRSPKPASATTDGSGSVKTPLTPANGFASPLTPITPAIPTGQVALPTQRRLKIPRDFYGFKQSSQHVTQDQYNAWYKDYKLHLARRKKKWVFLMNTHGLPSDTFPEIFPPKSQEVKRYVRKGIPPEWRGAAWFFYGDGATFLEANKGLYDRLVKQAADGAVNEQYVDIIERDLHRTFPDNVQFKPDAPSIADPTSTSPRETGMIRSLRRVLQAYAVFHPKVGYCQSLNFLAGHLLLFMRLSFRHTNYEERAFALLCILTERYLPGTHSIVLEGCDVDIGVLMTILQETMPSVWAKLDETPQRASNGRKFSTRTSVTLRSAPESLPDVSLATTAWFMSCFVSTLPIESTCRVWDCLWYEGSKTIFRVALAIFKLGEKAIRRAADGSEVFQIVQTLPKGLLDANELMKVATVKTGKGVMERLGTGTPGFGGLSQKTVESRREERRAFSKENKERRARGESSASISANSNPASDSIGSNSPASPRIPPPLSSPGTGENADGSGTGLKRSRTRGTLRRLKSMKKITSPSS